MRKLNRRQLLVQGSATVAAPFIIARNARAATKIRFLMNWYAEAEHGGYYQAKATGLYEKAGLDVELAQGGPQVNSVQLLAGDAADIILSYDLQILNAVERGVPIRAIASSFQTDIQGVMTRPEVKKLSELKGRRVFVSSSAYTSYWPWLKSKFGFTDDMAAPKGIGLQAFLNDATSAAGGYITSEPYVAQQSKVPVNFLLFSAEGWPAYTNPIASTDAFLSSNRAAIEPFLKASMEGWKSYMKDPKPGNDLIKQMNPKMDDGQIAFSLLKMNEINCLASGDAATRGIGTMSEARWRQTRDFMVGAGLLKPDTDWKKGFTTSFIDNVRVTL